MSEFSKKPESEEPRTWDRGGSPAAGDPPPPPELPPPPAVAAPGPPAALRDVFRGLTDDVSGSPTGGATMTEEIRAELQQRLVDRARDIFREVHTLVTENVDAPANRADVVDEIDLALEDETGTTRLELAEKDRELLVMIRDALRRMEQGSYGVCVECGEEIPVARLRAVPWAPRCAADQEILEERTRHRPPTL